MMSVLACPVCQAALGRLERAWVCGNRHSFDISRKGYVNLLLSHHKESKDPGDSAKMVEGRREFLNTGHYAKLAASLATVVSDLGAEIILDAGCGEGYFMRQLRTKLSGSAFIGIDISRHAIASAAKRDKASVWIVASTFRLPILSQSVDCLLRIMAPGSDDEAWRVLTPRGHYVVVTPGPDHLYGLKQLIYASTDKNVSKLPSPPGFAVLRCEQVRFDLHLQGEDILRLLTMTPYY
ncbi:MAG: 23S rRNA (guanine745-N1)-methyltransferase [Bacillota bacterium]|nr:MAG: 23S rRNA (guanine745-N1)-methyltransferase [Bacillota bacterium]